MSNGQATLTMKETGRFKLELMQSTSLLCTLITDLTVECASGLTASGTRCKSTDINLVIIGVAAGVVLVLCVLLLLVYIRRNPSKFKRIIGSFLTKEARMAMRVTSEVRSQSSVVGWDGGGGSFRPESEPARLSASISASLFISIQKISIFLKKYFLGSACIPLVHDTSCACIPLVHAESVAGLGFRL